MSPTTRRRAAWILALAVDALQIGLFLPTLGLSSLANNVIDLALMIVLWRLLGWHWAFLPTVVAEFIPFVELVPSWTLAVAIATRKPIPPSPPGAGATPEVR